MARGLIAAMTAACVTLLSGPSAKAAETRLVFERHVGGDIEIFEAAADGTQPRRLTFNRAVDAFPSWSPGGSQVAFASDRAGGSDIWMMTRDGTLFRRLTRDAAVETFPAWSPDGSRIAYARGTGLWIMSATGAEQRPIPLALEFATQPTWSPDGRRIAFVGVHLGRADLYTVAPDGSALTRVTSDVARESWPAWSPDGRRLAFGSAAEGSPPELHVALASGGGRHRIAAHGDHPTWTPDGDRIVFERGDNGGSSLFDVRPSGTHERRISPMGTAEAHPVAALAPATAPGRPPGPLTRDGRWLRDPEGRAVILHGVNVVHADLLGAPRRAAVGFDDDDVAFLVERGLNVVRLGIRWEWIEPRPGEYDGAYLDAVADLVDWMGARGLYVILDSHHELYGKRYEGGGFPDWSAQDDGLPAQPRLGFPLNYFAMPALNRAFDHFWADDVGPSGYRPQERYTAMWQRVAARFRDRPHVAYNLMNEPWPGSEWPACVNPQGCPAFDAGPLTRFHRRVAAAVREIDSRALILYEPPPTFNAGADSAHGDIGDENAVFAFHAYCEFGAFRTSDDCGAANELTFSNAEAQARETDDALLLGEFSSIEDPAEPERLVAMSDRHRIGWIWWTYSYHLPLPGGETVVADPALPPTVENLNPRRIDVLTRPYPRSVAGTPAAWSFDPATRRLELTYEPSDGVTDIALPAAVYPQPPLVAIEHGRRLDGPGDAARIVSDGGGEPVRVVVTP